MDCTTLHLEDDLLLPQQTVFAALSFIAAQDVERGSWSSPRGVGLPASGWAEMVNPMLQFLLEKGLAELAAGVDPAIVLSRLAVHAWFEGGVENYDRGQRDARRPRLVRVAGGGPGDVAAAETLVTDPS